MLSKIIRAINTDRHEKQWMMCCALLSAIVVLNLFDGISMILGGIERHSAPEMLFLVQHIPLTYQGVFLILMSMIHAYGMGSRNKILDLSLVVGAVYYGLWAFGVFWSWFFIEIASLGLFSKSAFICALYLIVARYSPHPHRAS